MRGRQEPSNSTRREFIGATLVSAAAALVLGILWLLSRSWHDAAGTRADSNSDAGTAGNPGRDAEVASPATTTATPEATGNA